MPDADSASSKQPVSGHAETAQPEQELALLVDDTALPEGVDAAAELRPSRLVGQASLVEELRADSVT